MDLGLIAGFAGALVAAGAYIAGATAFPAAALVSVVSIPLAIVALRRGSWRMAAFALYFFAASLIVSPAIFRMNLEFKWIVALGGIGAGLSGVLYVNYLITGKKRQAF